MVRRKGGQPGNQNAVSHGRYSAPVRGARKAADSVRAEQHRQWLATIPKTDYGAICDAIKGASARSGRQR
jgi:hypothetical protein